MYQGLLHSLFYILRFLSYLIRLSRLQIQAAPAYLPKSLQALIGGFDLDPNRVMDMVLSSLQHSCMASSTTSPTINALLKLLEQVKLGASLPQILGFKFQNCRAKMLTSLCRLTATLLSAGAIAVDALLPHLAPSMEKLAETTKRHAKKIEDASRLAVLFLYRTPRSRTRVKPQQYRDAAIRQKASPYQLLGLLRHYCGTDVGFLCDHF